MRSLPIYLFIFLLLCGSTSPSQARERIGRLGIGMSNQFINDVTAISFKLQRSPGFAIGLLAGIDTEADEGGMAAGFKMYKILFEEPNLNFYLLGHAAYLSDKIKATSYSGFQLDLGAGSEFNFAAIESLGFSVEFGLSMNKLKHDFRFQTMGQSLVVAGVHFYL